MKEHPADMVIRLAFLEGAVQTHGAWEKAVAGRIGGAPVPPERVARLEQRLASALTASVRPDMLTIGSFLRAAYSSGGPGAGDLAARLGLRENIMRMLENDRISPLRIPAGAWRKFRALWKLHTDVLEGMLRRSHQLAVFRPEYRAALARYRREAGGKARPAALEHAVSELFARAPLVLPPEDEQKLRDLMHAIGE